jgi:hypothetical protein
MAVSPDRTHTHVGWVRLSNGTVLSRDDVFAAMSRGATFRTLAPNGTSATVIRVQCKRGTHDYLRSDRDYTRDDNLDELPTF